jgi:hypothetical protein
MSDVTSRASNGDREIPKRLRRRWPLQSAFFVASAASAFVLLLTCGCWVRSYYTADELVRLAVHLNGRVFSDRLDIVTWRGRVTVTRFWEVAPTGASPKQVASWWLTTAQDNDRTMGAAVFVRHARLWQGSAAAYLFCTDLPSRAIVDRDRGTARLLGVAFKKVVSEQLERGDDGSLEFVPGNLVYVSVPYAWPAALAAIWPVVAATRLLGRRRRPRPGMCPKCGYDLRYTPARCPECGCQTPIRLGHNGSSEADLSVGKADSGKSGR